MEAEELSRFKARVFAALVRTPTVVGSETFITPISPVVFDFFMYFPIFEEAKARIRGKRKWEGKSLRKEKRRESEEKNGKGFRVLWVKIKKRRRKKSFTFFYLFIYLFLLPNSSLIFFNTFNSLIVPETSSF